MSLSRVIGRSRIRLPVAWKSRSRWHGGAHHARRRVDPDGIAEEDEVAAGCGLIIANEAFTDTRSPPESQWRVSGSGGRSTGRACD